MGAGGVDIKLSTKARAHIPLSIECKNTKTRPTLKDIAQARKNMYPNTLPIVVWKPHKSRFDHCIVLCRWDELYTFVNKLVEEKNAKDSKDSSTK
jgi:hypothetical protein